MRDVTHKTSAFIRVVAALSPGVLGYGGPVCDDSSNDDDDDNNRVTHQAVPLSAARPKTHCRM